jgi:FkbM family methyltransferase
MDGGLNHIDVMNWKREIRLLVTSDLTFLGKAAYAAARWSVTRWANVDSSRRKSYTTKWVSGEEAILREGTSDVLVFRELFLQNCYQEAIAAANRTSDRLQILDCGANIGLFAVFCARHFVSPSLVCVEPDAGNLRILEKNVAKLHMEVLSVPAFVGACNGLGYLHDCGVGEWGFEMSRAPVPGVTPTPVLDVPSLMKLVGWDKIDLLKVDIEGSEIEVFASSESWIDSVDSMVVEIHSGYSLDRFINDISRSGRRWRLCHSTTSGDQTVCSVTRM